MIRSVMVFSMVVTGWYYTHTHFGAFSIDTPDSTLSGTAQLSPPSASGSLIKTSYVSPSNGILLNEETLWARWIGTFKNGVSVRPLAAGLTRNPLQLANMTDEALNVLIQIELHRTGCYYGKINGRWDRQTLSALKSFSRGSRGRLFSRAVLPPPDTTGTGRMKNAVSAPASEHGPKLEILSTLRQALGRVCQVPCRSGTVRTAQGICKLRSAQNGPYDPFAKVTSSEAGFLPSRNPQRRQQRPIVKAEIPLPSRNLRKHHTAKAELR